MQECKLLFYNSVDLFNPVNSNTLKAQIERVPGTHLFSSLFSLFSNMMTLHDRTGAIITPVHTKLLDSLKMPEYRVADISFEEVCNKRARSLMDIARMTNRKLVVMYSGGVDSTLVLVSLLKVCTPEEIKNNLLVLMNEQSINENKNFYQNYIRGKIDIDVSFKFPSMLGSNQFIFVTGEGNDQLFGSAINRMFSVEYSFDTLIGKKDDATLIDFISKRIVTSGLYDPTKHTYKQDAEKLYVILSKVVDKCPVPIDTNYKFFWWMNFSLKWQSVYIRLISFAKENRNSISLEDNYHMFFSPDEFQLWSLNNSNNQIGGDWKTYKQVCKDIIYDYNKDSEYWKYKVKMGSLSRVVIQKESVQAIDENLIYYKTLPEGDKFFNPNNTFAEFEQK